MTANLPTNVPGTLAAGLPSDLLNLSDRPARILLVDDEPGLREAVQAYLEDSGFLVRAARDAAEGWEAAQQFSPDLVISDVMMPKVDGYHFLKQLREDDRFKAVPVVFLTARGMTADRIQGHRAGCDAYVPKPFDPDELVAIVENLLDRHDTCLLYTSDAADE